MTDGDPPDWDQLVEHNMRLVFRVAIRFLRSVQDAEDLVQDVFTEAFQFHQAGVIQDWTGMLLRLATLQSIDRLRQKRPTVELREGDQMSRESEGRHFSAFYRHHCLAAQ